MDAADAVKKGIEMKDIMMFFLAVCALWDMKTKKLPAVWLYGGLLWMGIYAAGQLIMNQRDWRELLLSLLPGVFCYLCARLTKQVGEGDAWLILGMGLCFSLKIVLGIVITAFFLSAVGAMVFMILKSSMKNKRIAFIPFLFCAAFFMRLGGVL